MKRTLLIILTLFAFVTTKAQIYQKIPGYGFAWDRIRPDSVLHLPSANDTLSLKTNSTIPQIRVVGDSLWWYKSGRWRNLTKSNFDTTSLSNRINLKVNISDTASMLSPYARSSNVNAELALKVNISDTANMLVHYGRVNNGANYRIPFYTGAQTLGGSDSLKFDYNNIRLLLGTATDYNARLQMHLYDGIDGIYIRTPIGSTGKAFQVVNDSGNTAYIDAVGRAQFYTAGSANNAIGLNVNNTLGSTFRVNGDESVYIGEAGSAPFYITRSSTQRYLYNNGGGGLVVQHVAGNIMLGSNVDSSSYKIQLGGNSLLKGVAKYATNYGSLFDVRSLVNKGYVDSAITANTSTVSGKLNISDTASMLSHYINNAGYGLSKSGQTVLADTSVLVNKAGNQTISGSKTFTGFTVFDYGSTYTNNTLLYASQLYASKGIAFNDTYSPAIFGDAQAFSINRYDTISVMRIRRDNISPGVSREQTFSWRNTVSHNYIYPDASGTFALRSDITSAINGSSGRVPLFTSANAIGNSQIYDNGTTVGVGSPVSSQNKLVSVLSTDLNTAYAIMGWGTGTNTGGIYSTVKSGNIFLGQGEVGGVSGERFTVANTGAVTSASSIKGTNFILSGGTGNTGLYYGHTDRVVLANYTAGGIDFETNGGSVNMTLFPNGNLGVGTSMTDDGSNKLQVAGSGKFTGNVTATNVISTSDANGNAFTARARASDDTYAQILFTNNAGTNSNAVIGVDKAGTNGGNLYFYTKPDGAGWAERMRITDGGKVGIGTGLPNSLFEINKSSNSGSGSVFPRINVINSLATQGDGSSTYNFADLHLSSGNGAVDMYISTTYAAGTWAPAGIINVATNHNLQLKTNNAERVRITTAGTVGIAGSGDVNNAQGLDKLSIGFLDGNYGWLQTFAGTPLALNKSGNNVLVGTGTDNGLGKLQVAGVANVQKANTFSGSLSVPNNTATLMQVCAADGGIGSMYLIIASIGGAGSDRIAMGILTTISQGGGTARWAFQNDGANMFLTDPGQNGYVYVKQTTGSTQTVNYSVFRISQ